MRFQLFKDKAGAIRFRLRAANGEIVATSESYVRKSDAEHTIRLIQAHAANATLTDETTSELPDDDDLRQNC